MHCKVLSTSPSFGLYVSDPVEYLKSHGCEIELSPPDKMWSEEELIKKTRDVDAIIVGFEKMSGPIIKGSRKLKIITKHGAGVDNIDIKAASERGIVVTSAPGANSDAVADLTIGLFLSLARKIPMANHSVKQGQWPRMVGDQVNEKALGIIGLGQVGKKVAKRAVGFDMRVMAYDVIKDEAFARQSGVAYLTMDEVLARSDFISVHVPLIPPTQNLIGQREFGLMKKGAYLVSISRGGIVNEDALYQSLKDGKIKGAALDVFSQEPPKGSPLAGLENVILTPHMAGYTYEALRDTGMICVRSIVDVLEGRQPRFVVNPQIFK